MQISDTRGFTSVHLGDPTGGPPKLPGHRTGTPLGTGSVLGGRSSYGNSPSYHLLLSFCHSWGQTLYSSEQDRKRTGHRNSVEVRKRPGDKEPFIYYPNLISTHKARHKCLSVPTRGTPGVSRTPSVGPGPSHLLRVQIINTCSV